jgi:hypothetical protein
LPGFLLRLTAIRGSISGFQRTTLQANMSETQQNEDQKFWETIDTFINLANEHEKSNQDRFQLVGASMLFAAARYNTYLVARANGNKEAFLDKKDEARTYFIEQFTKMLDDNIADYEANFDKYRG